MLSLRPAPIGTPASYQCCTLPEFLHPEWRSLLPGIFRRPYSGAYDLLFAEETFPGRACGAAAVDRVARGAAVRLNDVLRVRLRTGQLCIHPCGELIGRHDLHVCKHVGVLVAAVFGADDALFIFSFHIFKRFRVYPETGLAARHRVLLDAELRNPERVDDVLGVDLEHNVLAFGDAELVVSFCTVGVLKLPGPLHTNDLNFVHVSRRLLDGVNHTSRVNTDTDQDQRGNHRPDDLCLGTAMNRQTLLIRALSLVPNKEDNQERFHQDEPNEGDPEDEPKQAVDILRSLRQSLRKKIVNQSHLSSSYL